MHVGGKFVNANTGRFVGVGTKGRYSTSTLRGFPSIIVEANLLTVWFNRRYLDELIGAYPCGIGFLGGRMA